MNSLKEISSQKKPSLSLNASVYFDSINSPSSKVPHIKFEEKHQNEENNKINEIEKNKKMSIKNDSATSKINNYKSIMEIKKDPKCFFFKKKYLVKKIILRFLSRKKSS